MFKTIAKYASLYSAMFKASLIADLEYRANFLTRIVTDIFWYIAQITTFEVLYNHTTHIGDWNVKQMRVFLGILFIADALYMMLLHDNIENLSEKVRKGDLDLLLTKPVNAQFMLSLQKASSAYVGNLTMGGLCVESTGAIRLVSASRPIGATVTTAMIAMVGLSSQ